MSTKTQMDPTLSEIYGTGDQTEADLQKLAAAELAEELAEDGELDVNNLSDEQAEALASQVLDAETTGEETTEEETETTEEVDPELAKVAAAAGLAPDAFVTADRMGRVMAHANFQESQALAKEAGVGSTLSRAGHKAGRVLEAVGSKVTPKKLSDKAFSHGKSKSMEKARKGGASISHLQKSMTQHRGAGADTVGKLHKGVGGAAAAGAAGAAGYGGKKAMEKKSSALDILAERRALEVLEANGISLEKEAGGEDEALATALEQRVNERAVEILEANGYTFEAQDEK